MARPRSYTLSPTHRKIAHEIAVIERTGFPALISDLVRKLKLAGSSSLTPTLRIMQRNGYIIISGGGSQGRDQLVRLSPKARLALGEGGIPVLGAIPAGPLNEAIASTNDVLEPETLLPHRPGDFFLRVKGDSMINDGILSGDLVLLRPEAELPYGGIAAVLIGSETDGDFAGECETTLKRVYHDGEKVRLQAANPNYPDTVFPANAIRVAGIYLGLVRQEG
ncbi:MAG TPA: LexA family transcriptional regulator [Chthoniobacteraceae bacterium]|nr:LexA family transcriptional regulator [Chthoniobacteraceae bacterium]